MNIRIDTETEGADVVLHVAGPVDSLETQSRSSRVSVSRCSTLDLSKLMFIDETGAEVIQMLRERGAKIRGASAFIRLLINGEHS